MVDDDGPGKGSMNASKRTENDVVNFLPKDAQIQLRKNKYRKCLILCLECLFQATLMILSYSTTFVLPSLCVQETL